MPLEMPKGLPFSVDTWTSSSQRKRYHFLTHAHKDHSQGISTHSSFPIYSTRLTKILTLHYYPQLDESFFVDIEVGESISIDDDPDSTFTVTALDANHCPGAVMFLFEGSFGNILHTGDCRVTPECLQSLPKKYLGRGSREPKCRLDYVFLDCTFGRCSLKLPSKHVAVQQVINCIWKHPDAPVVYLTCDLLGQEEILVNVSQAFGSKIFIDKESNPECFHSLSLIVPEILSQDSSSRFHVFDGFPRLSERAETKLLEARNNFQTEPLIIRPSTQWYAVEDVFSDTKKRRVKVHEAVKDNYGIWHVCYSMHSSREELEWALQLLAPRWVVSTTPSCRAMELNYVNRNCFHSKLASDDPLWKLLEIQVEEATPTVEALTEASVMREELLNLPPPRKSQPLTLFGRARLGLKDSTIFFENGTITETIIDLDVCEMKDVHKKVNSPENLKGVDLSVCGRKDVHEEFNCNKSSENSKGVDLEICETMLEKSTGRVSPIGSSKSVISDTLRKVYRSMNIPVPRPFPSLEELLNEKKRAKRSFLF